MTYEEFQRLREERPELGLPLLAPSTVACEVYRNITVEEFAVIRCEQLLSGWLDGTKDPNTGYIPVALMAWLEERAEYEAAKTEA